MRSPAIRMRLAFLFVLRLLLSGSLATVWAQTNDEATLREMVNRYYSAYASRDIEAILRIWSYESPVLISYRKSLEEFFSQNEQIHVDAIKVRRVEMDAESARVCVSIELSATQVHAFKREPKLYQQNRTFHCVKTADGWRILEEGATESELVTLLLNAKNSDQDRLGLLEANNEFLNLQVCRELINRSKSFAEANNYSFALIAAQLAKSAAERIGERKAIIDALIATGTIYLLRGDLTPARESFLQAETLAAKADEEPALQATLQASLCAVEQRLANYEQATEHCRRSLTSAEAAGNKAAAANALNSLGIIARQRGKYEQAFDFYGKSLAIYEGLGDKRNIARLLNNLGVANNAMGNATEALKYYLRSIPIAEEIGNKGGVAGTLSNVSMIYRTLGNYKLALESSQRSFDISKAIGDKTALSSSLEEIGKIHAQAGEYAESLECYRKSLALAEETGEKLEISIRLLSVGNAYRNLGDDNGAIDYYKRGLSLAESIDAPFTAVAILNRLADITLRQGRVDEALELAERAVERARQSGAHKDYWQALLISGEAFRMHKQPALARRRFEEAIGVIEQARSQLVAGERDQAFFFESRFDPYAQMVSLLAEQGQVAEAFNFSERSKARVLLDVLQTGRVDINIAMSEQEKEQQFKLRSELSSLNTQFRRESQRPKADQRHLEELKTRLEKARLAHEDFQTHLYVSHPELRVRRGESLPIDLAQANELLKDPHTALLEYAIAGDKTFLFVLTSNVDSAAEPGKPALKLYDLNVTRPQLVERVRKLNQRIANNDIEYAALSSEMYKLLIAPAQTQLKSKTRLVIVPDDILWEAPFQALRSSDGRFLIQNASISYAPSLTVLREILKSPRHRAEGAMLAMGNPKLGVQTTPGKKGVMSEPGYEPLPEAERMVVALGRLYGSGAKVYVGDEAREDLFKAQASNYRLLQLSTHGVVNDNSPMYSHLLLAPGEDSKEDGLLEAWEIMQLDLKADLAILSACETARGRIGSGEGVIGLAWALFVAGCPTTVVSQWKVEASSTAELMIAFHRSLKAGARKSEAMRQAAIKLMGDKKYNHPFYWGGFIVVGDG